MKKILSFLLLLLLSSSLFAASALRSDSIDIRKTTIYATITDFSGKTIQSQALMDIESKMNGQSQVIFDLEGLTADSILWNGNNVTFSQSSFSLIVNTPALFNNGDTALIDIYYQGQPLQDATWGGYYFVGNYSFQMGVGFTAQPHSVGRNWHPCFDNMVERCSYEFYITTTSDKMGVTNGLFIDSNLNGNGTITWHYHLEEEIPSYLAAVAVSDYVWVKKQLNGNVGLTPAWIAAPAVDTNKVNGSFANLQSSFSMLEQSFGTHSFSKVGYTLVPFNAGAMEHATNIHIGTAFINGSLSYETLIAHELAHHWWGDLVTCSTVEDMWLNEGWASYAERLHQEFTYGREAYIKAVRDNHYSVLSSAHIADDGYKAIYPMDSLHTYGPTVYNKGADVIHTLRSYLGDSLFFKGTTDFINANKFSDISSTQLRDFLTANTGVNTTDYFADWIFQAGFPHFSIDSSVVNLNNNQYETSVYLRHRKHQAPNYYSNVPLEIGFYDAQFTPHIYHVTMSSRCMEFKVNLPFEPQMIVIDPNHKISDATTFDNLIVTNTGATLFDYSKARAVITQAPNNDSALLHLEHHWIAPDRFKTNPGNDFVLNDQRYWEIKGINLDDIQGGIQFPYRSNSANNYIDSSWLQNTEDNIRLFYRKNASQDWVFANDSIITGSLNDKSGIVYLKEIKAGEYCFGIKRPNYSDPLVSDIPPGPCAFATNIAPVEKIKSNIKIYPNPTREFITISNDKKELVLIELYNLSGTKLFEKEIIIHSQGTKVFLPNFPQGNYVISVSNENFKHSQKIQIR